MCNSLQTKKRIDKLQRNLSILGTPEGTRSIKVSLGLALASGAHPRHILLFESLAQENNKSEPFTNW